LLAGFCLSPINVGDSEELLHNGVVTALEILNIDMQNVELLILLSCHSASSISLSAEGNYGVQRACQVAGSQNVLCSLWEADVSVSRKFLATFLTFFQVDGKHPVIALKKTQDMFRNNEFPEFADTSHPRYWAGWVLAGTPPQSVAILNE
jgi:CHAT domain-containing protein